MDEDKKESHAEGEGHDLTASGEPDEQESEDKSEKDVLTVKLKEKLKKADKKTLQDVIKMLDTEPEGGNEK